MNKNVNMNYAQELILSDVIKKVQCNFNSNSYIDENYGDSYNDCSSNQIYSED